MSDATYVNIGGEVFRKKSDFRKAYESEDLLPLFELFLSGAPIPNDQRPVLIEAIKARIQKFKLQGVLTSNILIDRPRRKIIESLESMIKDIQAGPTDPSAIAAAEAAEATEAQKKERREQIKGANPFLVLFRTAWMLSHPEAIPDDALQAWTTMLATVTSPPTVKALLDKVTALSAGTPKPSPVNFLKRLNMSNAVATSTLGAAETTAATQLGEYDQKEAKEAEVQARIQGILSLLVTFQFIRQDKTDTRTFRQILSGMSSAEYTGYKKKIQNNIKVRLINAIRIVDDYYKTLYPTVYKVVEEITAVVPDKQVTKLLEFQDTLVNKPLVPGLYVLDDATAKRLTPWMKAYRANQTKGRGSVSSALSSASVKISEPFQRIWFLPPKEVKVPSNQDPFLTITPVTSTSSTEDRTKHTAFVKAAFDALIDLLDKAQVLMIVQPTTVTKASNVEANMSTFPDTNIPAALKPYADWKVSAKTSVTLASIGVTIPDFDPDLYLSNQVLQLCTLTAFKQQIESVV
jgi:hypothetical protein